MQHNIVQCVSLAVKCSWQAAECAHLGNRYRRAVMAELLDDPWIIMLVLHFQMIVMKTEILNEMLGIADINEVPSPVLCVYRDLEVVCESSI